MKIGIDARLLTEPVTGIGRYTAELTGELIQQPGTFFLYSPRPIMVGDWRRANVTLRTSGFRRRMGGMLWSQTALPYWAARDRVDLFWGTTHRLPRYLPASVARVVTIHDLVWKHAGETMRPLSRWVERRLMPEAVRLADRIIADSASTASDLEAEYPEARGRVCVVNPGGSTLPAPLGREALVAMGVERPYFLFVGTLEPRKNLRRLLRAYALLDGAVRAQHQLVITGGRGWGGVDIHALIQEAGLDGQVVATGYVDDCQLATLYVHACFLAMPSLYEGFGLPLVEAMGFGVPVLTSNVSSMPDVAGDAGLLVNPLDERDIAAGLSSLLSDSDHREHLAAKAKANAGRFSWRKAASDTWAVMEEAVEVRRRRLQGSGH
jgi:glycosyltransferase involved in cell wall biosynthesis